MFVNRGMIEAAKTEGEVAGVMAHEISHVALRHGTAQASKATQVSDRRRSSARIARRDRRRHRRPGDLAGHVVRPGHRVHAVRPRVRAPGRHRGRADHGARRLRPARHGEHVPDDREAVGRLGPGMAQRPSQPRQPLGLHHQGSGADPGQQSGPRHGRVRPRQVAACGRCRRRRRPRKRPAATDERARRRAANAAKTGRRPAASPRPRRATPSTKRAGCSASACRRTGASWRATRR